MTITLALPFDALMGDNHRLIPARGRLIGNPDYTSAKAAAALALKAQMRKARRQPFDAAVRVHLALYFPDMKKRDQTNYAKFLHDAMSGVVYFDDADIVDARQTKHLDRANPRVEITVTPLPEAA